MEIEILSFNCWDLPFSRHYKARIRAIVDESIHRGVDIICFQEMITRPSTQYAKKTCAKGGYQVFFDTGFFNLKTNGGLFTASQFSILRGEYVPFRNQGTYISPQVTDRFLQKGYHRVLIEVEGSIIALYNTHLTNVYKKENVAQANPLRSQLNELTSAVLSEEYPVILAGDLNLSEGHTYIQKFLEETGLEDPPGGPGEGIPTVSKQNINRQGFLRSQVDYRYDYTLLPKDLNKKAEQEIIFDELFEVAGNPIHLSDHYGVLTRMFI